MPSSLPNFINSMTGYAVVEANIGGEPHRVHLKSVNHRYFEVKWRAPRTWMPYEIEARALFLSKLARGSVDCWIEHLEKATQRGGPEGAQVLFERLQRALTASKGAKKLSLPTFVRALILARFPEVWWQEKEEKSPSTGEALAVLRAACEELVKNRRAEGERLSSLIRESTRTITDCLATVEKKLPELQRSQRDDLRNRLQTLSEELRITPPQEQRLMQEYLTLSEKRDVSEELGRIKIHLDSVKEVLNIPPAQAGKRLEFITQELHREWTTLGTKIHDPYLLQTVMDAKLELDRIKEQSANIG